MFINTAPATLYSLARAQDLADLMAADDDDWTYRVVPVGARYARIDVYENGELIGSL